MSDVNPGAPEPQRVSLEDKIIALTESARVPECQGSHTLTPSHPRTLTPSHPSAVKKIRRAFPLYWWEKICMRCLVSNSIPSTKRWDVLGKARCTNCKRTTMHHFKRLGIAHSIE